MDAVSRGTSSLGEGTARHAIGSGKMTCAPTVLSPQADVMLYHRAMNAAHHHHSHPKLSRNQSEILACLRKAKEPMSAYAILDRVRTAGISHPPTVYRALNELMQKGMVHRLQSKLGLRRLRPWRLRRQVRLRHLPAMRQGRRDSALRRGPGGAARARARGDHPRAGDARACWPLPSLPSVLTRFEQGNFQDAGGSGASASSRGARRDGD